LSLHSFPLDSDPLKKQLNNATEDWLPNDEMGRLLFRTKGADGLAALTSNDEKQNK